MFFLFTRRRSTLPGPCGPSTIDTGELNFCVRDGNRCDLSVIATRLSFQRYNCFSVRTSTSFAASHAYSRDQTQKGTSNCKTSICTFKTTYYRKVFFRSSPRPISIGQLNTLLCLHLRPINHVVYMGSYQITLWEILSWSRFRA